MIQNIGSIKILKNKISLKILLTFSLIFLGGMLNFIIFGAKGMVSFEAGFVCFMIIFLSLRFSVNQYLNGTQDQQEYSFSQKFSLGLGVSFSFYRLLSYIVLILVLIGLMSFDCFLLYSYMAGIFTSLLASFYKYY